MNSPSTEMNNQQIAKLLTEGLENKDSWGYGFRRITVKPINLPDFQYTFTALGYKDQDGEMYLGMRMNVDQYSPLELHKWDLDTDIRSVWPDMLGNLYRKHMQSKICKASICKARMGLRGKYKASWRSGSVFGS